MDAALNRFLIMMDSPLRLHFKGFAASMAKQMQIHAVKTALLESFLESLRWTLTPVAGDQSIT
jgi:hypothetical protein